MQTGKIPKKSDSSLDWTKLQTVDYLGTNFNKTNPITAKDIVVIFDTNNSAYIKGIIESANDYNVDNNYLYNFYVNKIFRVNTIPPLNTTKDKLVLGSQILYNFVQKDIVSALNETSPKDIKLANQSCTANAYFYELKNEKLTLKYCKSDHSFDVYQEAPIYLENSEDLEFIKANIGDKAYVKKNNFWYEYYYQGDVDTSKWIPSGSGSVLTNTGDGVSIEDRILSYIPDAKDLVFRRDGGCMLANGDIFCWGNNQYKKAGIENYGQLDTALKADYVNTPVMLKVQIEDSTQNLAKWYNNPYRIKFEKMAMNSTNVCGISPIYDYYEAGVQKKYGGDLYCNGQITSNYYENISTVSSETSILSKNKYISTKTNGIYLTDIVMVEDTIAALSDDGKIYTIGRNYKGTLGIGSNDKFIVQFVPVSVKSNNIVFKKIFALRDIATFGAIDTNNLFYIWGERPNGTIYYEPTIVSDSIKFNSDAIFTNSKDFLLKGVNSKFYRTTGNKELSEISQIPSSAISASIYDKSTELYLYVNENMELKGSDEFLICKETGGVNCDTTSNSIFKLSLDNLNAFSSTINNKRYASFSNVSIYQLDTIKTKQSDNFEDGTTTGWVLNKYNDTLFSSLLAILFGVDNTPPTSIATETYPDTTVSSVTERVDPTRILGRFTIGNESVEKTYSFGSTYSNNEVEIEFDFYEIDSWDTEKFQVFLNDTQVSEDRFIHDNHPSLKDTNDTGIYTLNLATHYNENTKYNDEKYHYKIKSKLDSNGKINIRFRVKLLTQSELNYSAANTLQVINDESWGIDNISVKVKETSKTFVCAMTGLSSASQMYCWGNTGRSIPILSTSLYDVSKIGRINKLFISQESDKLSQMSFDEYNNSGNLFLKYPSYIGGFDYPFYFK